jgi:hypothetical protein
MKRTDAFRKLRTICHRLDEIDANDFYVVPLRLYLFGSVLTDKPKPTNLNLMLAYREPSDMDPEEMLARIVAGHALPSWQAVVHLRRGMKMVRIDTELDIDSWLQGFVLPEDVQVRLVWEPGLNWSPLVDELEAQPLLWDEAKDDYYKQVNEQAANIAQEKGNRAAYQWVKEKVFAYHQLESPDPAT